MNSVLLSIRTQFNNAFLANPHHVHVEHAFNRMKTITITFIEHIQSTSPCVRNVIDKQRPNNAFLLAKQHEPAKWNAAASNRVAYRNRAFLSTRR